VPAEAVGPGDIEGDFAAMDAGDRDRKRGNQDGKERPYYPICAEEPRAYSRRTRTPDEYSFQARRELIVAECLNARNC
jgi:hypothetical protein